MSDEKSFQYVRNVAAFSCCINLVYSNLSSILKILNAVMTKYPFLANKDLILETEPRDYLKILLKFWPCEPHFLINFFLIKEYVKLSHLPS